MLGASGAWCERFPERFDEERRALQRRGFTLDTEALDRGCVEFLGASQIEPRYRLRVVYPDGFPSFPPRVFTDKEVEVLPRHHRQDSREVCLFGPGQPRWSASLDGVTAIDEAEKLIRLYSGNPPPLEDDLVPEPQTEQYQYAGGCALLVPPSIATPLAKLTSDHSLQGSLTLSWRGGTPGVQGQGIVQEVRVAGTHLLAGQPYQSWVDPRHSRLSGTLYRLHHAPPSFAGLAELKSWLRAEGLSRQDWLVFTFPEEAGSRAGQRLAWLGVYSDGRRKLQTIRCYPMHLDERNARIPGMGSLTEKKVLLIGAGSLGSRIGVALAASGVRALTIVDADLYEPWNSVRHEVGPSWFGIPKAEATARRAAGLNPEASEQLQALIMQIGAECLPEAREGFVKLLQQADIVVETTGDHKVSHYVDDLCYELGVPCVYVSVTNGAWAGEVVRVLPGQSACWRCWYAQFEGDPPPGFPVPAHGYFAPGCGQPTFTGALHEVGVVADLAASVCVETLLRDERDHGDLGGDYVRWQARDETGNFAPCITVHTVARRAGCPVCGVNATLKVPRFEGS